MIHQALIAAPQVTRACAPYPGRPRSLALVITSTSAMLAGLAIGPALGLQQSFLRALTRGDRDGV